MRPLSTPHPYLAEESPEFYRESFAPGVVLPFSLLHCGTGWPHGRSCDRPGGDPGTLWFAGSRSAAAGLVWRTRIASGASACAGDGGFCCRTQPPIGFYLAEG